MSDSGIVEIEAVCKSEGYPWKVVCLQFSQVL